MHDFADDIHGLLLSSRGRYASIVGDGIGSNTQFPGNRELGGFVYDVMSNSA
jgi:hypothetical protein